MVTNSQNKFLEFLAEAEKALIFNEKMYNENRRKKNFLG